MGKKRSKERAEKKIRSLEKKRIEYEKKMQSLRDNTQPIKNSIKNYQNDEAMGKLEAAHASTKVKIITYKKKVKTFEIAIKEAEKSKLIKALNKDRAKMSKILGHLDYDRDDAAYFSNKKTMDKLRESNTSKTNAVNRLYKEIKDLKTVDVDEPEEEIAPVGEPEFKVEPPVEKCLDVSVEPYLIYKAREDIEALEIENSRIENDLTKASGQANISEAKEKLEANLASIKELKERWGIE